MHSEKTNKLCINLLQDKSCDNCGIQDYVMNSYDRYCILDQKIKANTCEHWCKKKFKDRCLTAEEIDELLKAISSN